MWVDQTLYPAWSDDTAFLLRRRADTRSSLCTPPMSDEPGLTRFVADTGNWVGFRAAG
jgi:hypothetical protein